MNLNALYLHIVLLKYTWHVLVVHECIRERATERQSNCAWFVKTYNAHNDSESLETAIGYQSIYKNSQNSFQVASDSRNRRILA